MTLAMITLGLLGFQGAQAQGIFSKNILGKPGAVQVQKASQSECVDFTGEWVGTCEYSSGGNTSTSEQSMSLIQGACDEIVYNNSTMNVLPIGGMTSISYIYPPGSKASVVISVRLFWNPEKTELTGSVEQSAAGSQDVGRARLETMKLDKGELVTVQTMEGTGGYVAKMSCRQHKKN